MSFLTTCDELREARSEIKRVPENSRGSARSNYLRKVRGVSTDRGVDIFFSVFPLFLHRTSFRRFIFFIAFASATGNWRSGKRASEENYFELLFCARVWRAISREKSETRGQRDVELAELNTAHKLRREGPCGVRRTAGRNLISLANEFLSKSRVSRLM